MNVFERILEYPKLPYHGICNCIKNMQVNDKEKEVWSLIDQNENYCWGYSGGNNIEYHMGNHVDILIKITPLRQTILMLCNEIYKDEQLKKKRNDKKRKKRSLFKSC